MNYYQEITITVRGIGIHKVWTSLFSQVHLALVENKNKDDTSNVGVSFPEYKSFKKNGKMINVLGCKLRLFANSKEELEKLNIAKWCERFAHYLSISDISRVDDKATTNIIVKRFRQVKNNDRTTRSFARKYGLSFEEVKKSRIKHYADKNNVSLEESEYYYDNPKLSERPYVRIMSLSNNNGFSIAVEQRNAPERLVGTFSTYGMSSKTTVPHW